MRHLCTALALVVSTAASAAADPPPLRVHKGERPFWSWVIAPHADEVATVLEKVEANRNLVANSTYDPDYLDTHRRALDDALGMLRYALELSPDDPVLRRTHAEVALDRGLLDVAAASFERYLAGAGADDNASRGGLGIVYALQGRYGEAIEPLRAGVAVRSPGAIEILAQVYMERGRVTEAIDLLDNAPIGGTTEQMLSLAVAYDRDEQVGEAAETLGRLSSTMQASESLKVTIERFAPAIDQRYYAALLHEAFNELDQARAEWMAYAAARPAPRFRARALAHIAAIDALGGHP